MMQNLRDFSEPQKVRVLKNSNQYLIFSCEHDGKNYVHKIAHKDRGKLEKEISRIESLTQEYPLLRARMASIHSAGTKHEGIHAGKSYFVMNQVPGLTFSHFVQQPHVRSEEIFSVVKTLVRGLTDIAFEHRFNPAFDRASGTFLTNSIREAAERIKKLPEIAHVSSQSELVINGRSCPSIFSVLEELFRAPRIQDLDSTPSTISELGHWNFHGDNILLSSPENASDFRVIDPDVKIDACDPMFGIARFIYSFPHDSADYESYFIHSQLFSSNRSRANQFEIMYLWPQTVYENYSDLFSAWHHESRFFIPNLDERFANPQLRLRLELCILLCLLRGVYANYEEVVEFIDGRLDTFRHKALYLYLQACQFASRLCKELYEQRKFTSICAR